MAHKYGNKCICEEVGADGTTKHSGKLTVFEAFDEYTIVACANHRENYSTGAARIFFRPVKEEEV